MHHFGILKTWTFHISVFERSKKIILYYEKIENKKGKIDFFGKELLVKMNFLKNIKKRSNNSFFPGFPSIMPTTFIYMNMPITFVTFL